MPLRRISRIKKTSEPADMEVLMTEIIQSSLAGANSRNKAMNDPNTVEGMIGGVHDLTEVRSRAAGGSGVNWA